MSTTYRPEIDGLRALAVLPVIFFHAGFAWFKGGYAGVDVFFVISGYLITAIITADMEKGRFSILSFYERRARRILPALFLVMAAALPFGLLWMLPLDLRDFTDSMAAVTVFASNFLFWSQTGYFDVNVDLKPLLHTWSLAVEEQFYVLFPALLWVLRRRGRKTLLLVLAVIAISSFVAAQLGTGLAPSAAFYLLPTRAWELMVGAVASVVLMGRSTLPAPPLMQQMGGLVGVLAICGSVVFYDQTTAFPGLPALLPTLGAALIILFANPETQAGRLLAWPPMVGLGLISYSAYLWHQPIFAFARYRTIVEPLPITMLGLTALSLFLAYLSWHFVERPFRNAAAVPRDKLLRFAATAAGLFLLVGLAGHVSGGFAQRLDDRARGLYTSFFSIMQDDKACKFHSTSVTPEIEKRFDECAQKFGKALVILGDSHAMNLFNAVYYNTRNPFVFGLSNGGCRPHTPQPQCHYDAFLEFISTRSNAVKAVVYAQAGFYLLEDSAGTPGSRDFFKTQAVPLYAVNDTYVDLVEAYLRKVSAHTKTYWLGPWTEPHLNARAVLQLALACNIRKLPIHANTIATFDALDRQIAKRLFGDPAITYVSANDILAMDWSKDLYSCDGSYWADTDHMSVLGEKRFGARLVQAIDLLR
jgi:peptidoglycan/LPS O-acetylase OafA/YrhL